MQTEIDSTAGREGISQALRVKLLGIGSAGARAVAEFKFNWPVERIAVDTSQTDLSHIVGQNLRKFMLGEDVTRGLSTGANAETGEKAARASETEIREMLAGTDLLFVVTSLGRGTGSGAASVIAKIARELGIMTICFATMPFSWEGRAAVEQATAAREKLCAMSNAFVLVESDMIAQIAGEVPAKEGFRLVMTWIENGVNACCAMLFSEEDGAKIDFGTFKNIFPLAGTPTLFAFGSGKGDAAVDSAVMELFSCPLLRTHSATEHSDTLVIHLRVGSEPTMSVVNEISQRIQGRFGGKDRTLTSYTVVPALGDSVEICVVGAGEIRRTREKIGKVIPASKGSTVNIFNETESEIGDGENSMSPAQGELFSDMNRGVFQSQAMRLYDGVDLDSPTYIRRQVNLQRLLDKKKRELQK